MDVARSEGRDARGRPDGWEDGCGGRYPYLRDALPGLFALGEKPTAELLLGWLPDRWLLNRARGQPIRD
jgi:hypothetical protein